MLEVLLDWAGEDAVDEERLAADVDELVVDFADVPLKDIRIGALHRRITAIVREHGIVLPADLTLMFKAFITLEGLGRKYDPEFRLVDRLKPFVDRAIAARYAPAEVGRRGGASLGQFLGLLGSVPRDLARLLKDARRGRMRIDLDLKRLDSFGRKLDSTIDRITIGIMTASVVIGSSIVMTVTSGPQLFGMPIFTVLGSSAICWRSSTASGSSSRSGARVATENARSGASFAGARRGTVFRRDDRSTRPGGGEGCPSVPGGRLARE